MGAKGTKNGQRKQYTLDDGQVVDVFVVAQRVNCSISLALARLNTSSNPDYIFMDKGTKLKKGHPYVKLEKQRKALNQSKNVLSKNKKFKNTKLTAKERALKKACIAIGISWGVC
jgi:hypothetical protein